MNTAKRIESIRNLVSKGRLSSHQEILDLLKKQGVETNQAAVSRDLKRLGVSKHNGYYVLPQDPDMDSGFKSLCITPVGDNLMVVRTKPGFAMAIGLQIDELSHPDIIGTVAGDDTIFVAISNKSAQKKVTLALMNKVAS